MEPSRTSCTTGQPEVERLTCTAVAVISPMPVTEEADSAGSWGCPSTCCNPCMQNHHSITTRCIRKDPMNLGCGGKQASLVSTVQGACTGVGQPVGLMGCHATSSTQP